MQGNRPFEKEDEASSPLNPYSSVFDFCPGHALISGPSNLMKSAATPMLGWHFRTLYVG